MARVKWMFVGLAFFIIFCLLFDSLNAQTPEEIPLNSWIYNALDELRVREYSTGLWAQTKPYTRDEVYQTISMIQGEIDRGVRLPAAGERALLARLGKEFDKDNSWVNGGKSHVWRTRTYGQDKLSFLGKEGAGRSSFGGNVGLHFRQRATLFSSVLVDQELGKDPLYTGYRWQGRFGDFDAAYAQIAWGPTKLLVGRGKLFWGPGIKESVILSDNAPALDQVRANVQAGSWMFSWFTAELDPLKGYLRPDTIITVERANRFMVGHRVDVKVGRSLEIGVSETFVYGGQDRQFEPHYLNPLLLYHAVQYNDNSSGNTLFGFDGRWVAHPKCEIFGEVLIDDWQIEHKTPQDEEPSHLGFQVGLRVADPLGLEGTYAWASYTRVNNWVYNVYQPYERYIFKGKSLGWSGGNDGNAFSFTGIKHLSTTWDVGLGFAQKRHGEGRLDALWPFVVLDNDTLTKRGFRSEPFPSGVVERNTSGELYVRWQPSADAWIEAGIGAERIKNEGNIEGNNRSSPTGRLLARCQLDWLVP